MKIPEILFEDLITKERFNLFKLKFIRHDIEFNNDLVEDISIYPEDIVVEEVVSSITKIYFEKSNYPVALDEEIKEDKEYNFFQNFFSPSVKKIPKNYKRRLHEFIEAKSIYGKESKLDFYDLCIKNLLVIYKKFQTLNFLKEEEKDLINQQLANCQDYLSELKTKIESNFSKIPFNLKNKELTTLFYLLNKHNIINQKVTIPELGVLMQNYLFYDNKKPLINTSKYLYAHSKKIDVRTFNKLKEDFRKIFFDKQPDFGDK